MSEQDFKFYVPVDLIKSSGDDEAEDSWQIQGIASTGDMDYQGEIVDQSGLDISHLKAGKGSFNHDHQPGPNNVLGAIDDAEFVEFNGAKALMVKGYLFKHQKLAQGYYGIMKSLRKGAAPRVHFSIEGKILERDKNDVSKIKKARITKVALTENPVNGATYANLIKSLAAIDEDTINKSDSDSGIQAGADAGAPEGKTGGAALIPESLDYKLSSNGAKKFKRNKKKAAELVKSVVATLAKANPGVDETELTRIVCESFKNKITELT